MTDTPSLSERLHNQSSRVEGHTVPNELTVEAAEALDAKDAETARLQGEVAGLRKALENLLLFAINDAPGGCTGKYPDHNHCAHCAAIKFARDSLSLPAPATAKGGVETAARKLAEWFGFDFDSLSNEGRITDKGYNPWGFNGIGSTIFQGCKQDVRDIVLVLRSSSPATGEG